MGLAADSPLKFGWVEDGTFVGRTGNSIHVEFPPSLESHTQTLFWPQAVKKIEEQLSAHLGERIKLECRFTGAEPPPPAEQEPPPVVVPKHEAKSPPQKPVTPAEPVAPAISAEELDSFKNDPLIKKALEIFRAEILAGPQGSAA
jgi:hypothetical protein